MDELPQLITELTQAGAREVAIEEVDGVRYITALSHPGRSWFVADYLVSADIQASRRSRPSLRHWPGNGEQFGDTYAIFLPGEDKAAVLATAKKIAIGPVLPAGAFLIINRAGGDMGEGERVELSAIPDIPAGRNAQVLPAISRSACAPSSGRPWLSGHANGTWRMLCTCAAI